MLSNCFQFSARKLDGEVWFELEGRAFTRDSLQRALVYANKGVITTTLFSCIPLWQLIEVLEFSSEYYSECYNNEL